jgi:hypothetical protein
LLLPFQKRICPSCQGDMIPLQRKWNFCLLLFQSLRQLLDFEFSKICTSVHFYVIMRVNGYVVINNVTISLLWKGARRGDWSTLRFVSGDHKHNEMSSNLVDQYCPRMWAQMRGGWFWGLSQWVQLCTWSQNKLWRSNFIFNVWLYPCEWEERRQLVQILLLLCTKPAAVCSKCHPQGADPPPPSATKTCSEGR